MRIHRPASYTASVGSERASKTRQRERGQVCYRCGVALERLSGLDKRGARLLAVSASAASRPHELHVPATMDRQLSGGGLPNNTPWVQSALRRGHAAAAGTRRLLRGLRGLRTAGACLGTGLDLAPAHRATVPDADPSEASRGSGQSVKSGPWSR